MLYPLEKLCLVLTDTSRVKTSQNLTGLRRQSTEYHPAMTFI